MISPLDRFDEDVPMDPTTALQAVRAWSVEDRLDFVFRLWDQLVEDGWQPEPTDDLIAGLDRRLAAHEADPSNVRTWEQVLERVRKPR
jgi:putative addiction module component (TIGR02574 family)